MQETQLTSRVYLVLALVDPPPPRKVRKKSISDHSVNSSLSLFNKQVIVGFSLVEWNLQASTIYLCHSCQRSITSDPRTVAIDIARSAIKRVLKDSVELFASVAGVGAGGSSRASLKTDAAGPPSSSYFHCIDHIYSVTVKLEEETVFDYNENGGRGDGRSTRDSSTNTDNMLYPSSSSVRKSEVHDGESLYNRAGFMELSGYLKKHQVDPSLFPIVDSFLGGTPSARVYAAHISDVLANLEQKLNRK